MSSDLKSMVEDLKEDKGSLELKYDKLKIIYLSIIYFFVNGAYTIISNIKNSIFMGLVGRDYVPEARLLVLFLLVPAILFYSKLVDKTKRYKLLAWYSIFYCIGCLGFAYLIGHPTIGIPNTFQSPLRIFGWVFYVFVEGFSPFVLSVFWAFSNSVSRPDSANKGYGLMVSFSKIGGMLAAGLSWMLFSVASTAFIGNFSQASDVSKMRIILLISAIFLAIIPLIVWLMVKRIPKGHFHGYEAVYKAEKNLDSEGKSDTGIFAGLKMFFRYPYVFGIFCMVFLYEVLNTIISFLRLGVAEKAGDTIAGTSAFLFKWNFIMHAIGLAISFFGTTALLRKLGTKVCVFLVPITMGMVILCFMFTDNVSIAMAAITFINAFHYAFEKPVVESLYIPTLKEIRFKSKAWIDAFGGKAAKSTGSILNILSTIFKTGSLFAFSFAFLIGVWSFVAFFLGRRFEKAILTNEAIGSDYVKE